MSASWLSFSRHHGHFVSAYGRIFQISIILEHDYISNSSTAVRVVLVRKTADDTLSDLVVSDRVYYDAPFRTVLNRSKNKTRGHESPFIPLVFEIQRVDQNSVQLVLLSKPSSETMSVLFDRHYRTTEKRVLVTLESSVPVQVPMELGGNSTQRFDYDWHRIIVHDVRLLSLNASSCPPSRRPSFALPLEVLRQIASYAIEPMSKGWRRDLFSFGLVNKECSQVLELYFGIPANRGYDSPSIFSYLNSLCRRPDRAKAIRQFGLTNFCEFKYLKGMNEEHRRRVMEAAVDILKMTTRLTRLDIDHIDHLYRGDMVSTYPLFDNLDTCCILGPGISWWPSPTGDISQERCLVFDIIPILMMFWPSLTKLEVVGLVRREGESIGNFSDLLVASSARKLQCNLEDIDINGAYLSQAQLLNIIKTPKPCLRRLDLQDVSGLSNGELYDALSLVSRSLVELRIGHTNMPKTPTEEYGVDRVISQLNALQSLDLSGECYSSLSIARKTSSNSSEHIAEIILTRPGEEVLSNLAEAMEVGGWEIITIYTSDMDRETRTRAHEIAGRRGIDFCQYSDELYS